MRKTQNPPRLYIDEMPLPISTRGYLLSSYKGTNLVTGIYDNQSREIQHEHYG